jgi:hypothetical protein
LIFQPGTFFDMLRQSTDARQWFWVALLILILTAFSTVRTRSPADTSSDTAAPVDSFIPSEGDLGGDGGGGGVGGEIIDFGAPPSGDLGTAAAASTGETESEKWQRGIISASNIILAWLILIVLLSQASLANGSRPSLGKNLQVAVWAGLPLALMAGLQLIYDWRGGEVGPPGLSGLLPEWSGYPDLSDGQKKALMSLATRFTLFEWWAVLLVYLGARFTLASKRWVAGYIALSWAALVIMIPVLIGSIKLPEEPLPTPPVEEFMPGEMLPGEELMPGGEFEIQSGDVESIPAPAPVEIKPGGQKG